MTAELNALIITAASIGFFHTILGPDHYLPFVMMSWARKWSGVKTTLITVLCGLGHIGSSVVLGLIGVSVGVAVNKLEFVESFRGNLAAWLLIAFGLVYFVWGLRRAYRGRPHEHSHTHTSEAAHTAIKGSTPTFTTTKQARVLCPGRCLSFSFLARANL